ncbi:MAG: hypothetical protein KatS3mg010_0779 [Acidimicrobiia bacterium]|nr:MAG: hypothetical protein KatS3mg010_0779 [Acidimicrobiia bacterium]
MAPGPLLPTVTQFVPVLKECGSAEQHARWLPRVAAGECTGTLAIAEATGSFDPADTEATFRVEGDEVVCSGTKRYVIEADAVDEIAVVARGPEGIGVVVVPATATRRTPVRPFDGSRRLSHVELDGVRVEPERVLRAGGADAAGALRRAIEEATVALALEMVGTAQSIFDVTLEYAKQRVQFGVPIGSFQAVKHKFADMVVALERGALDRLFRGADDRRGRPAPRERDVGREGSRRRLPAAAREGGHPTPRRHRLHVGARHAPLREARQVGRAAVRDEQLAPGAHRRRARRLTRPATPGAPCDQARRTISASR